MIKTKMRMTIEIQNETRLEIGLQIYQYYWLFILIKLENKNIKTPVILAVNGFVPEIK